MADHYRTEVIEKAVWNFTIEKGMIFHSDKGSNHTSDEFGIAEEVAHLEARRLYRRMSR
ncbi:hypothetical protein [Streptosporangium sp. NPDC049644]|uniref:hypothetical protein n=1 Tax=Streptosporangium sp. NPDC049644 TaxID=3155507 RepID=UPI003435D000